MKSNKSVILLVLALICTINLTGCMSIIRSVLDNSTVSQDDTVEFEIIPTEYTLEDLDAMYYPGRDPDTVRREETYTQIALENYNIMLGHVESVIGKEYYITSLGFSEQEGSKGQILYSSYIMHIVLKEWFDEDKWAERYDFDTSIVLSMRDHEDYNDRIASFVCALEPFMMARKQTADLKAAFAENYPYYHVNTFYLHLDKIHPLVAKENYEQADDYNHFFIDEDYFYIGGKRARHSNTVTVLLPPGTLPEDVENIARELYPLLKKHYVGEVLLHIFKDEDSVERVLSEEGITGNYYNYDRENFVYGVSFKVVELAPEIIF
ncbi:MAG: hypothetical protein FWD34_08140 [Oscillospiraceae bacterium]|nr:hypothetical protein [Oscillospiraceae bacterium]